MSSRSERVAVETVDIEAYGNNAESPLSLVAVCFADAKEKRPVGTASAGVSFPRAEEELPDGTRIKSNSELYPAIEFTLGDIAPEVVKIKVVARPPVDGEPLQQAAFISRSLKEGQSYTFDGQVAGVRLITLARDEAGWSHEIDLPPETW